MISAFLPRFEEAAGAPFDAPLPLAGMAVVEVAVPSLRSGAFSTCVDPSLMGVVAFGRIGEVVASDTDSSDRACTGGAGGAGTGAVPVCAVSVVEDGLRYIHAFGSSEVHNCLSSSSAAPASAGRACTDRWVRCPMNRATAGSMPGHCNATDGTSSCTCLNTSVTGLSEMNGIEPVSISHAMIPTAYRSP